MNLSSEFSNSQLMK